jgi:site-specific recombinase XerD
VHLIEDGAGIEYVQDLLGHKNIQNTMVYARVTDQRREEVADKLARNPQRFRV